MTKGDVVTLMTKRLDGNIRKRVQAHTSRPAKRHRVLVCTQCRHLSDVDIVDYLLNVRYQHSQNFRLVLCCKTKTYRRMEPVKSIELEGFPIQDGCPKFILGRKTIKSTPNVLLVVVVVVLLSSLD